MVDQSTNKGFETKMQLKGFVKHSIDNIVDLLRVIDHPKRLEILAILLEGNEIAFKDLQDETDLQKSAIANHLSLLTDRNLLEKCEKGVYKITIDGAELVERIAECYLDVKIREQERLENLMRFLGHSSKKRYEGVKTLNIKDENIRIIELPHLRVVSFQAMGTKVGEPETKAWLKAKNWAEEKDLFKDPQHKVYGFNNPCPPNIEDGVEYGYEFWITIPKDFEIKPEDNLVIKEFSGGLYAVMTCKGIDNIGSTWQSLSKWIKENNEFSFSKKQWLEHHVDLVSNNPDDLILDLYAPVQKE